MEKLHQRKIVGCHGKNIMYKFAAASTNEPIVFGSSRPGYVEAQVKEWIDFMQQQGIERVCCLLTKYSQKNWAQSS